MQLKNLPIRRKLIVIILLTSVAVMIVMRTSSIIFDLLAFRESTLNKLSTLGEVVASNCTASLAFYDKTGAFETLTALKAEPNIVAAVLYDKNGIPFSIYPETLSADSFPHSPTETKKIYSLEGSRIVGFQPVVEGDKKLGMLYLNYDISSIMFDWILGSLGTSLVLMLAVFVIAYIISRTLQNQISKPILALAETARKISDNKDYSVRAIKYGENELGLLTDAFNHMLTQVQSQLTRLNLLRNTTRAIGEHQDIKSIFQVVIKNLEDHLQIDFGGIFLYDKIDESLTVGCIGNKSYQLAKNMDILEEQTIDIDENGLSRSIQGQLVYEPDITQIMFPFPQKLAQHGLRSVVMTPLLAESEIFGVLIVAKFEKYSFNSTDCEFLRQLSEHVALASHQAQLYDSLQKAYDDLRQTQQSVMQQERLRALGQMASGIAHDINNAISPISLYTASLLERETGLSERARDYLETIQKAIEDVSETVARMREFYRQRETQLVLTPVDLNTMVKQVVDLTKARWNDMPQEKGIMVKAETELTNDLPAITGIGNEIREAITNLIFNAVDAMPEGGTITIRTGVSNEKNKVHLEIIDTGIGMDEETKRKCLEPFFSTKGERGTGLGLAMVFGMIKRHNADIEIESSIGAGTTVRLSFPVVTQVYNEARESEKISVIASPVRILVIDDDPIIIKSLQNTLESDGHSISTANNGQEGLSNFLESKDRNELFNLVITDLGMPYMDGRKVAEAIKSVAPATPVILLTGWGRRMLDDRDIPPHVDRILSKPPKLNELREAIMSLCFKSEKQ